MSKVYKFIFYATDPHDDCEDYNIAYAVEQAVGNLGCVMSNMIIDKGNKEFEWEDDIPLNFEGCSLSEWERYMGGRIPMSWYD